MSMEAGRAAREPRAWGVPAWPFCRRLDGGAPICVRLLLILASLPPAPHSPEAVCSRWDSGIWAAPHPAPPRPAVIHDLGAHPGHLEPFPAVGSKPSPSPGASPRTRALSCRSIPRRPVRPSQSCRRWSRQETLWASLSPLTGEQIATQRLVLSLEEPPRVEPRDSIPSVMDRTSD